MTPTWLIKTKSDEEAIKQGAYFDESKPAKIKAFIEKYCVQSKHPWDGKPIKLLEWQYRDIIAPLYGWRLPSGRLRHNRALIFVGKKNGKTALTACLALWHLLEQQGSEVACIASEVQQASVLYGMVADYCELHPALSKRLWVRRNIKQIHDKKAKSKLSVLSSTPHGKSGYSLNFCAYDEITEWPACHAREIYDRLSKAGMAREDSVQIVISTANYCSTEHLGFELFKYAQDLKSGAITDIHTLPVVYSLDASEDFSQPDNWRKVNPSMGYTVPESFYQQEYEKTLNNPNEEFAFRTFLLNTFGLAGQDQWLAANQWAACGESFDESELYGSEAMVGIDLSMRGDISAITTVVKRGERYYLIPHFFCSRDNADIKEVKDGVPYRRWHQQGHINLTAGEVIDTQAIIDTLLTINEQFDVLEYRFDPYGAELLRQQCEYQHGLNMVATAQHYSVMAEPTAWFERLCIDEKLRHPSNPVLNWMAGNASVRRDKSERVMIEKTRHTARVDGITSSIIGLSGWLAYDGQTDILPQIL